MTPQKTQKEHEELSQHARSSSPELATITITISLTSTSFIVIVGVFEPVQREWTNLGVGAHLHGKGWASVLCRECRAIVFLD